MVLFSAITNCFDGGIPSAELKCSPGRWGDMSQGAIPASKTVIPAMAIATGNNHIF